MLRRASLTKQSSYPSELMPQLVRCQCGQHFSAAEHLYGQTLACPYCKAALTIPRSPVNSPVPVAVVPVMQTPCPSCRRAVSEHDNVCPHCWYSLAMHRIDERSGGRMTTAATPRPDAETLAKRDHATAALVRAMQAEREWDDYDNSRYGGTAMWLLSAGLGLGLVLVVVFSLATPSRFLSGLALFCSGGLLGGVGVYGVFLTLPGSNDSGWAENYLARRGALMLLVLGSSLFMFGFGLMTNSK